MKKTEWVYKKLVESEFDNEKVYAQYEEYKKKFNTKARYSSFERLVRKTRSANSSLKSKEKVTVDKVPEYENYNREDLIKLIHDEVETTGRKVKMKELSEITCVPVGAFLKYVSDFGEIVKSVYQENMFYVKSDIDISKLKSKLKFILKENKYLKQHEGNKDALLEVIKDAVKVFIPYDKPVKKIPTGTPNRVAQLLFSDAHFGDVIKKEQVIVNEYNPEIAKQRIDSMFNQTLEYCELVKTNRLDINILGDMISGRIHQEILENTAFTTTEAVIKLADYIAQWINTIVENGYIVDHVRCIVGNHGRMTAKPNFDNKSLNNFEWFLYEFIKRSIEGIVNHFEMPQSIVHIADVFETRLGLLHGDIFKGGTGLNPVSGTWGRDSAKLNALFSHSGEGFDILGFGHFHNGEMLLSGFDKTKLVVNGSVKGTDSFSIGAVKTGARPNQTIFCIEEGKKGETQFFQTLFLD